MHAIIRRGNGKYYISAVFDYYSDVKSQMSAGDLK